MTKSLRRVLVALCFMVAPLGLAQAADPANTLYLELPTGRVVIEMRPDLAPETVTRIRELVHRGFYDGMTFHRVIPGFMAQTGDPKGDGSGGTGHHIKPEFSNEAFVRGVVGMARSDDPNSADSQFFIMTGPKPALDHQYTVWGKVTSGIEHVDALKAGGGDEDDGKVDHPDHLIRAEMAADADKGGS